MPTSSTSPHLPFGENKNADWYGKDIISVKQFGRDDLEYVFGVAHEMRGPRNGGYEVRGDCADSPVVPLPFGREVPPALLPAGRGRVGQKGQQSAHRASMPNWVADERSTTDMSRCVETCTRGWSTLRSIRLVLPTSRRRQRDTSRTQGGGTESGVGSRPWCVCTAAQRV